jgi:hypothetical protein
VLLLKNQIGPSSEHTGAYTFHECANRGWLSGARWAAVSFGRTDGGELCG